MKKFVVLLLCISLFFIENQGKSSPAFNENNEEIRIYELSFENKELSTLNFAQYFLEKQVISIQPVISKLYETKMSSLKVYSFVMHQSIEQNISQFQRKYIDTLEQLGYRKEAVKVKANGILIKKVVLYGTEQDIQLLYRYFSNFSWKEKP